MTRRFAALPRLPEGVRRQALHRYLREVVAPTLAILPYDDAAAAWHAEIRAHGSELGDLWRSPTGRLPPLRACTGWLS